LAAFGAPLHDLRIEELTSDDLIFQIGVEPVRIDILTDVSGVRFADAWPNRVGGLLGGVPAEFLGRGDLIVNKRASGRPKDLADLDRLERDVWMCGCVNERRSRRKSSACHYKER